jgi:hypothetical protein
VGSVAITCCQVTSRCNSHFRGEVCRVHDRKKKIVPDPVAWQALDPIANDGLAQEQVVRLLGASTRTLNRELSLHRRVAQENAIQIGWESC